MAGWEAEIEKKKSNKCSILSSWKERRSEGLFENGLQRIGIPEGL